MYPKNSNDNGWIKIFREVRGHWIWQDQKRFQWWIDLLCLANYTQCKMIIRGQHIEVQRGQLIWSQRSLAKRWMTTPKTVRKFLRLLASDNMVVLERVQNTTRITICNYNRYQGCVPTNGFTKNPTNDPQRRRKEEKKNNEINSDLSDGKNCQGEYKVFINRFNQVKGSKFTYMDAKAQRQFKSRIGAGYTTDNMITALQNFMKEQYHFDCGFKHLTPEFVTRSDKIEKGLSIGGSLNDKSVDFFNKEK